MIQLFITSHFNFSVELVLFCNSNKYFIFQALYKSYIAKFSKSNPLNLQLSLFSMYSFNTIFILNNFKAI